MEFDSRNKLLILDQAGGSLRITRKRTPYERSYSIIKGRVNGSRLHVTITRRVWVKMMFKYFCYNLFTPVNLTRHGKIVASIHPK